jgi:cell division protein FtsI/penicillin-binding protein 2
MLQIVHYEYWSRKATHQYVEGSATVFDRGAIFFTDKDGNKVAAATLGHGYTLAIIPYQITNEKDVYEKIHSVLPDVQELAFMQRAAKKDDPYEEITTRVPESAATTIRSWGITGIVLVPEQWRFYPGKGLAAQTVGFVGDVKGTVRGAYGLERHFEDVLSRDESSQSKNFFSALFGDLEDTISTNNRRSGDVVTTINPQVQAQLEKTLQETQDHWKSKRVVGIVMDPNTGEIVAQGAFPSFDPNTYNTIEDQSVFSNPIVEHVYEMGSIIKVLTYAAGIDAGVIDDNSTYFDSGSLKLDGFTVRNFDNKARNTISIKEVLRQSLNVGAAHIAKLLGPDNMRSYFREKYKLNEETGVDLPGEVAGKTANLNSKRVVEFATASFGQGVALTPVATIRAIAAVANGGYLVQPHVVKELTYRAGGSSTFDYSDEREHILKTSTSTTVSRVLASIVDEKLGKGKYKMEHYSIAAKTGTAQIAKPSGGYYDDRFLHSFVGYVPAYDPKYIILLMNVEPHGAKYASETLSDPFIDMVHFLINYYDIKPDR